MIRATITLSDSECQNPIIFSVNVIIISMLIVSVNFYVHQLLVSQPRKLNLHLHFFSHNPCIICLVSLSWILSNMHLHFLYAFLSDCICCVVTKIAHGILAMSLCFILWFQHDVPASVFVSTNKSIQYTTLTILTTHLAALRDVYSHTSRSVLMYFVAFYHLTTRYFLDCLPFSFALPLTFPE